MIKIYSFITLAASLALTGSRRPPAKQTMYYFDVIGINIPASKAVIFDSQVLIREDPLTNPGDVCSGSAYLCILGFLHSQLTAGREHLNTNGIPISYFQKISTKN